MISTCQHIKIRLGGNRNVVLPVGALLKQYKDNPDSALVRHFDLLFVQQSIGKLSRAAQLDLLPILLEGIASNQSSVIFNLFLRLLPLMHLPSRGSKEDEELRAKVGLTDTNDSEYLAMMLGKLILFNVTKAPVAAGARILPLGLSKEDYAFFALDGKEGVWDPKNPEGLSLPETKVTVLKFLASGAFNDAEKFIPACYAAADIDSRISSIGDDLIKRTSVSLEDEKIVLELYKIYKTSKPALRTGILLLLGKSKKATEYPLRIREIITASAQPTADGAPLPQGLEASKLRNAMFSFLNWVSRNGEKRNMEAIAPFTITFLTDSFEEMGWPLPQSTSTESLALRALAYETIGSMAKSVPSEFLEPNLQLVRWLFRSLREDSSNVSISIESAMAGLLNALSGTLDPEVEEALRHLLLKEITQDTEENEKAFRSTRFVAVRWANRCLKYSDVVARWIDVCALALKPGEKSDIAEEGGKGLDPYWCQLLQSSDDKKSDLVLPDWKSLVEAFFTPKSILDNDAHSNARLSGMNVETASVFGNFGTRMAAYAAAVAYCKRVLMIGALRDEVAIENADWERQMEVLIRTDKESRQKIRNHMSTIDTDTLSIYFTAAFEGMLRNEGKGLGDCGKSFIDLASLAPLKALGELAAHSMEVLPAVLSNDAATRLTSARALGLLAPHPSNCSAQIEAVLAKLIELLSSWKAAIGADQNKVNGCLVALGHVLSRAVFYGRRGQLPTAIVDSAFALLLEVLDEATDNSTKEAALIMLGQVCAANLITAEFIEKTSFTGKKLIEGVAAEAMKGSEKAISALGRLSLVFPEDESESSETEFGLILQKLYKLYELKQPEVHFTVGEALAVASSGWKSDSLLLTLDVDRQYHGEVERKFTLDHLVIKLLKNCKTTKPSLKKASGIWLFSLIQYCGHLREIQSRLRESQAAFMGLLSARDELVQETASRGLSLVYEQGDKELRERLVADLVASFTGTSTKIKVDEETELFEPGALPTGEGQSITSYKDIMSLAAEVGDQTLVYKFMSLASNAATWSTRAAFGRFGLSSILSDSSVDPKLYPVLYRYRFDPNPNVQRSMNDIWSALVKHPSGTISENYDAIMTDLLKNILGKEWRTRESCCSAIADLVQSSRFEKYEKYLSEIWTVAFKVLDDIKGSVRKSAEKLCQVLTGILVRQLEAGVASKNATAMLKEVMPFLFSTRGLESPSREVQGFAYDTLLKLVKSGGISLRPFIPMLVENVLGLLSLLEPDWVNHLAQNQAALRDKIDAARSAAISHSPLMESVERCLDLLDEDTMKALVPHLENVIKTAVGMPSKLGCAGVLVNLATRHSFVFRPHADHFLKLIEKAVLDRNSTVSASYAKSAGYLARLATDAQLLKLATFTKTQYFAAEDETRRQISAEILYAVSKHASDRFNALSAEFLPFVFFAKHDFDQQVRELCEKTWDENVGGSRAVLMYLTEIINLSSERLDSPKWTIKHTAALTIADVVSSASTDLGVNNATLIWPALEAALKLKTFEGKEKVINAFVAFTKSGKAFWSTDAKTAELMTKIAIREAKRNNMDYKPHAIRALGEYAEARADVDLFDLDLEVIKKDFDEALDEDKMDVDDEDKKAGKKEQMMINAGVGAIIRAAGVKPTSGKVAKLLKLIQPVFKSQKSDISTRLVFYERAKAFFVDVKEKKVHLNCYEDTIYQFFALLEVKSGAGTEMARTKRAEAANAMIGAMMEGCLAKDTTGGVWELMKKDLEEALSNERATGVKRLLEGSIAKIGPYSKGHDFKTT